jgi:hypothetical protein
VAAQLTGLRQELRRHIEVRALVSTQEAAIVHAEQATNLRKTLEVRAQLAADEAKSYADHGLGVLAASLAAANRVVVDATKRISAVENALASAEFVTRFDNIERELGGMVSDYNTQLRNVEHRIEFVRTSEFIPRLENIERELGRLVNDYNTQLRNVEHRVEFVRSETMYEMQASRYRGSGQAPARTVARITEPAKVEAMRATGLRLNVGCGHIQLDGYLNVDSRALPGIDVVADATNLPFQENELAEIYSSHLVEHFTSHILERVLLPHWSALLQSGGVLTTIAPDGAAMLQALHDGEMEFSDFKEVIFGGQDYDGDFHYNILTPKTFSEALGRVGFKDIVEEYAGRRNGKCLEFKISARKA